MANAITSEDISGYDAIGGLLNFTAAVKAQEIKVQEQYLPVFEQLSNNGGAYINMVLPMSVLNLKRGADETVSRSEEHTSELQSRPHLVCRLLLEKKKETAQGRLTEAVTNQLVNFLRAR